MGIKDSMVVQTALESIAALKNNGFITTSLHPELLDAVLQTSVDCPEKPESFKCVVKANWENELVDEICLMSGGADSTIAWFLTDKPLGLYIDIGQEYAAKELNVLEDLKSYDLKYRYIDLKDIGAENEFFKNWKHIIPGRNFLFLTIAAEMLKDSGRIIFSAVEGEGWNSNKGDKSEQFVYQWQKWYTAATGKNILVCTLSLDTKPGWLKRFLSKGFDINIIRYKTVTCFSKENRQCGSCQACLRKYLSFISAFNLDTSEDYIVHPMIGCTEYIEKYKKNLRHCLEVKDFSHYSINRCNEDLIAIRAAEHLIK
jgi:7-cyano-7-deazaguanine synthase in queuosine biosynthesis